MHIIYFINSIKYLIRNKFTKIRTELCNLAEVENFQEELEEECGQALEQKVVLDMFDTQKIAKLSYSFSVLVALIIQITIILFSIKAVNGNKYHLLVVQHLQFLSCRIFLSFTFILKLSLVQY